MSRLTACPAFSSSLQHGRQSWSVELLKCSRPSIFLTVMWPLFVGWRGEGVASSHQGNCTAALLVSVFRRQCVMLSIFNPPHSVKQDPVKPANQIIVTCRREGALAAHQAPALQGETLRANRPERLRHSPCSMKHQVNISTATLYSHRKPAFESDCVTITRAVFNKQNQMHLHLFQNHFLLMPTLPTIQFACTQLCQGFGWVSRDYEHAPEVCWAQSLFKIRPQNHPTQVTTLTDTHKAPTLFSSYSTILWTTWIYCSCCWNSFFTLSTHIYINSGSTDRLLQSAVVSAGKQAALYPDTPVLAADRKMCHCYWNLCQQLFFNVLKHTEIWELGGLVQCATHHAAEWGHQGVHLLRLPVTCWTFTWTQQNIAPSITPTFIAHSCCHFIIHNTHSQQDGKMYFVL